MQDLRKSQQTENMIDWQTPKVVLPRLQPRKGSSLPSYGNIKSGGDCITRTRPNDYTISEDYETQFVRPVDFPKISAKSWIIYNKQQDKILRSCNPRTRREIASLTKLLTAICVVRLSHRFNITLKQTFFRVTGTATDVTGTLAYLQPFEWVSVCDLLYGMMLPSGNDAANLLAQNFGAILYFEDRGQYELLKEIKSIDLTEDEDNIDLYMDFFQEYMNGVAKQYGMKNSKFTNPHGLDYRNNYSCCEDLLKLTLVSMENDIIRKIAATKQYRAQVRLYRNKIMYKKSITWQNTNKLLGVIGCQGLKTGYTPKAGGCLSSLFETVLSTNIPSTVVIIVLGCKTQDHRFSDTTRLIEWYMSEEARSNNR